MPKNNRFPPVKTATTKYPSIEAFAVLFTVGFLAHRFRSSLRPFSPPVHNGAMPWESRPLRDIRELDLRRLLESSPEEHLQLEYKSALYEDNDRGRPEFPLDLRMFANASGGASY